MRVPLSDWPISHAARVVDDSFFRSSVALRTATFDQHLRITMSVIGIFGAVVRPVSGDGPKLEAAAQQFEPRARFAKVMRRRTNLSARLPFADSNVNWFRTRPRSGVNRARWMRARSAVVESAIA